MISNEEMYEFASLIAGISDSDLQQYKCGGKTKKVKKAEIGALVNKLKKQNLPDTSKPKLPNGKPLLNNLNNKSIPNTKNNSNNLRKGLTLTPTSATPKKLYSA